MANSNTSLNGYEFGRSPRTAAPFWGGSSEGAAIDDTGVYTDKTWSSKKISDELAEKADASDLASYAKVTSVYTKSESYSKAEVDNLISDIPAVDAYTKTETDALLSNKANVTDVYTKSQTYTKTEVDNLISGIPAVDAYTKTQTDALLANKANVADVYTKTETDSLLAGKAGVNSVYTKGQTDRLLTDKANAADVYTKTQTYTKTEVDNLISQAGGGVEIDDNDVVANKTWSSQKIDSEIYNATSGKANSADVYTKTQTDNLLTGYAKSTAVYTKTQTYTKTEVDNLISSAGGEVGVKRFILKPYEIAGIAELFGAETAFTHQSYMFELLTSGWLEKFPIILTKGDGSTVKVEFRGYELLPWNENDTNSVYPKADAVYRKFSVGGMDFGMCFTGNHLINERYYPDVIIVVDASLDITSIAINTTDYTFHTFGIGESYNTYTPESLFRDYDAYPRKDEVVDKSFLNYNNLVGYQSYRLKYYNGSDWVNVQRDFTDSLSGSGVTITWTSFLVDSVLSCSQEGSRCEIILKLKSGYECTANFKYKIGTCPKPLGVDTTVVNGFVYDGSTYLPIEGAGCAIKKNEPLYNESNIMLVFNRTYTTTGNEIVRLSYTMKDND